MAFPAVVKSCSSLLLALKALLPAASPAPLPPLLGSQSTQELTVRAAQAAESKSGTSPALLHPELPDAALGKDPSARAAAPNSSSGS